MLAEQRSVCLRCDAPVEGSVLDWSFDLHVQEANGAFNARFRGHLRLVASLLDSSSLRAGKMVDTRVREQFFTHVR